MKLIKKYWAVICLFLLLINAGTTYAANKDKLYHPKHFKVGKPTFQCVIQAAYDHNVPPITLLAINSIERGSTGQNVGNKNGSVDTGAFQINSIHFKRAKRSFNATHHDLSSRGCYNAQFAAMLLSEALNNPKKQHLDYYSKAAGYHSWTTKYNKIYRKKLIKYTMQWNNWINNQRLNRNSQTGFFIPKSDNPFD